MIIKRNIIVCLYNVQFVSLCYYEYFSEEILNLKQSLGLQTGEPDHDKKDVIDAEKKLKFWKNNTTLYLQLQWFDTVESVDVSAKSDDRVTVDEKKR